MMLFLLPRRIPMLALIATNLVISMPAPPSKSRSPEDGFSSVPKILEIQLPLKIATKDDLVAWARYVMGLMASKINITLTTVKEAPSKAPARAPQGNAMSRYPDNAMSRYPDNAMSRYPAPPTGMRSPAFPSLNSGKPVNGVRQSTNPKSFESARYAENVRNFATNLANLEKTIPAAVRIQNLENSGRQAEGVRIVDNGRQSVENSVELQRNQQRNENLQSFKDKVYATAQFPSINGVTTKSLFNNLQVQPTFNGFGITDTTVPSPLEITANINVPRTRIKEPVFVKSLFDSPNLLKTSEQQLFVPPFPEFGPAVTIDVKPTTVFRNTNVVSPPTRAYLPVPTTSDNIKFPNDPFVTRYFFDGIEKNVSSNFGVDEITFTTQNPPVVFNDELSSALRGVDFLSQQRNASSAKPLLKLPFEAVITFTREEQPVQTTTLKSDASKYFTIPTRDPPDQFPPYFDTSNFTVTNESGQINVVFDDGTQVTENTPGSKKEERKKQEKKKDSSKKEKSKKQKLETKRRPSAISQLLKTFIAIRRNNTPSTNLSPPPFDQQASTTTTTTTTTQRVPMRQRVPPPQKTQLYSTERPSSVSRQKGRRNQTSLAQQVEDDDDDSSGSKEEDNDSKEEDSKEESGSKEDSGGKSEENGNEDNDDVESEEGNNSDDESSSESESSEEEEEGGGSINAIIELLMLAGPALEDLSDPDSDADIVDLLELAVPLLQDLSEGDGENEASDIPALVVPVLMQLSEGPDGPRDSAAILTPLLQLIAPVIGPLSGPLLVPLSRQSSNTPGEGGSNIGDLSSASLNPLLGPLLEPIGPGKMTRLSNLIATVVSSLSKNSGPGGKSDLTSLVKAVVAGSIAGTSAGSSGSSSSSGHKDTYGAPTGYDNGGSPRPNGYPKPPVHSNSDQLGSSINEILNAIFKVVASLVNAISTVLNASSKTFTETDSPPTHDTRPKYGAPPKYSAPPRYRAPPKHGAPARNKVPLSETISITTSEPQQLIRK